jgi:hypothetical protein
VAAWKSGKMDGKRGMEKPNGTTGKGIERC